jgi:hypothetical protein
MPARDHLPAALEVEMSHCSSLSAQRGWEIFEFRYEPQVFGNWYIDLFHSDFTIRLVKDRSQYSVDGDKGTLEPGDMRRTFTDSAEFQQAVIEWIEHMERGAKGSG